MSAATPPSTFVAERLRARNEASRALFAREAEPLARACRRSSERFSRGGRLLAFGRDQYATDAQHVAVEFVHPVIVGKRALPALDLSLAFARSLPAVLRPEDVVMGFGPPAADAAVLDALELARRRGAMTFALPGAFEAPPAADGDHYVLRAFTNDAFVHQELVEVLYHTLWETVHVFFEHREMGHDVGAAAFLYPFLGARPQDTEGLVAEVAESIRAKAGEDERLRELVAREQSQQIVTIARALRGRLDAGGSLLLFGNGGSATDANDWALDCATPAGELGAIPAVSLAADAANLSAIANDVGTEAIFLRQLVAHARPGDVAIALSTSGGSPNVVAALEAARQRGLVTVALLGTDGGEVVRRGLADHALVVPSDYVPRIQEIQASIYHVVLELLRLAPEAALHRPEATTAGAARAAGSARTLELYGSGSCPFTRELREDLLWRGERFVEHDVDVDEAARERLRVLCAGEARVPVLAEGSRIVRLGWNGRTCVAVSRATPSPTTQGTDGVP